MNNSEFSAFYLFCLNLDGVYLKNKDIKVQEVVVVTVCERLGDRKEWLSKARQYMGKTTFQFSQ